MGQKGIFLKIKYKPAYRNDYINVNNMAYEDRKTLFVWWVF